jgi:hypothetical protein
VSTSSWSMLCRGLPVARCTRTATIRLLKVPLVPSLQLTVCHASSGRESISSLAV